METEQSVKSDWWYGIAATAVLGVLLYVFVSIVSLIGPESAGQSDTTLVTLVFSAFGAFAAGILIFFLTIAFVVCFVFDWRKIRKSDVSWNPSLVYLVVPAISLVNFIQPVIAVPVIIVGAGYYLHQRSTHIGTPALNSVP